MEEHGNGRVEETQKEESGGKAVEGVKELFEELKSKVLHVEEAVLDMKDSSISGEKEGERAELEESEKVEEEEEEELGKVSDPVEVVSSDMTQEVEIPVEDDLGHTDVVEEVVEEIKEKIFEFKADGSVEKKVVEETEVQAWDASVAETSEEKDEDSVNPSPAAVAEEEDVPAVDNGDDIENVNKDDIITETTRTSPVTSIADRASWRNCCGLFDVLRRNK